MTAYYNEIDPHAARWLRNLIAAGHIAPGDVDERSIVDVDPADLFGYTQCHFFAGIGGWSYAARLAGWPDDRPLWTGSCPCQPFSHASRGRGGGFGSVKDLWPSWFKLLAELHPETVFGEQVTSGMGWDWLDRATDDLEREAYAVWPIGLCASLFGFPGRERIYFVADTDRQSERAGSVDAKVAGISAPRRVATAAEQWLSDMGDDRDGLPFKMGRLRAYGNAIVPQVAAEVIGAYLDCHP